MARWASSSVAKSTLPASYPAKAERKVNSACGSKVLTAASTLEKEVRAALANGGNVKAAEAVGTRIAEKAKALGIEKVALDRGGLQYHGRIKALAEAARAAGLKV